MKRSDARVLVVDDEPSSRVATHHALRALGCRVIDEAAQGTTALQLLLLAERPYDLVISNWKLSAMTGLVLVQSIRHAPRLQAVPVVIATEVTPAVVAEAAEAGVSAFLPRPFDLQVLEEVLRIFVGPRSTPEQRDASTRLFLS